MGGRSRGGGTDSSGGGKAKGKQQDGGKRNTSSSKSNNNSAANGRREKDSSSATATAAAAAAAAAPVENPHHPARENNNNNNNSSSGGSGSDKAGVSPVNEDVSRTPLEPLLLSDHHGKGKKAEGKERLSNASRTSVNACGQGNPNSTAAAAMATPETYRALMYDLYRLILKGNITGAEGGGSTATTTTTTTAATSSAGRRSRDGGVVFGYDPDEASTTATTPPAASAGGASSAGTDDVLPLSERIGAGAASSGSDVANLSTATTMDQEFFEQLRQLSRVSQRAMQQRQLQQQQKDTSVTEAALLAAALSGMDPFDHTHASSPPVATAGSGSTRAAAASAASAGDEQEAAAETAAGCGSRGAGEKKATEKKSNGTSSPPPPEQPPARATGGLSGVPAISALGLDPEKVLAIQNLMRAAKQRRRKAGSKAADGDVGATPPLPPSSFDISSQVVRGLLSELHVGTAAAGASGIARLERQPSDVQRELERLGREAEGGCGCGSHNSSHAGVHGATSADKVDFFAAALAGMVDGGPESMRSIAAELDDPLDGLMMDEGDVRDLHPDIDFDDDDNDDDDGDEEEEGTEDESDYGGGAGGELTDVAAAAGARLRRYRQQGPNPDRESFRFRLSRLSELSADTARSLADETSCYEDKAEYAVHVMAFTLLSKEPTPAAVGAALSSRLGYTAYVAASMAWSYADKLLRAERGEARSKAASKYDWGNGQTAPGLVWLANQQRIGAAAAHQPPPPLPQLPHRENQLPGVCLSEELLYMPLEDLQAMGRSIGIDIAGRHEASALFPTFCAAGAVLFFAPLPLPLLLKTCEQLGVPTSDESSMDKNLLPDALAEKIAVALYRNRDEVESGMKIPAAHLSFLPRLQVNESQPGCFTCSVENARNLGRLPLERMTSNRFSFNKVKWRAVLRFGKVTKDNAFSLQLWHRHSSPLSVHAIVRTSVPKKKAKAEKDVLEREYGPETGALFLEQECVAEPGELVEFSGFLTCDVALSSTTTASSGPRIYSVEDDRIVFQLILNQAHPGGTDLQGTKARLGNGSARTASTNTKRSTGAGESKRGSNAQNNNTNSNTNVSSADATTNASFASPASEFHVDEAAEAKRLEAVLAACVADEESARRALDNESTIAYRHLQNDKVRSALRAKLKAEDLERRVLLQKAGPPPELVREVDKLSAAVQAARQQVQKLQKEKSKEEKEVQRLTEKVGEQRQTLADLASAFKEDGDRLADLEAQIAAAQQRLEEKKRRASTKAQRRNSGNPGAWSDLKQVFQTASVGSHHDTLSIGDFGSFLTPNAAAAAAAAARVGSVADTLSTTTAAAPVPAMATGPSTDTSSKLNSPQTVSTNGPSSTSTGGTFTFSTAPLNLFSTSPHAAAAAAAAAQQQHQQHQQQQQQQQQHHATTSNRTATSTPASSMTGQSQGNNGLRVNSPMSISLSNMSAGGVASPADMATTSGRNIGPAAGTSGAFDPSFFSTRQTPPSNTYHTHPSSSSNHLMLGGGSPFSPAGLAAASAGNPYMMMMMGGNGGSPSGGAAASSANGGGNGGGGAPVFSTQPKLHHGGQGNSSGGDGGGAMNAFGFSTAALSGAGSSPPPPQQQLSFGRTSPTNSLPQQLGQQQQQMGGNANFASLYTHLDVNAQPFSPTPRAGSGNGNNSNSGSSPSNTGDPTGASGVPFAFTVTGNSVASSSQQQQQHQQLLMSLGVLPSTAAGTQSTNNSNSNNGGGGGGSVAGGFPFSTNAMNSAVLSNIFSSSSITSNNNHHNANRGGGGGGGGGTGSGSGSPMPPPGSMGSGVHPHNVSPSPHSPSSLFTGSPTTDAMMAFNPNNAGHGWN